MWSETQPAEIIRKIEGCEQFCRKVVETSLVWSFQMDRRYHFGGRIKRLKPFTQQGDWLILTGPFIIALLWGQARGDRLTQCGLIFSIPHYLPENCHRNVC